MAGKQEQPGPFTQALLHAMQQVPKPPTAEQKAISRRNMEQKNRYQGALALMQSGATQFDTAEKALAQVDRLIELTPFQEIPESVESAESTQLDLEQAQA